MGMREGANPDPVDLEAVTKLVEALERDLAKVKEGQGDVATLRSEVEALRAALEAEGPHEAVVQERLHGVRSALEDVREELAVDTFGVGRYLVSIGRMLGLS